MRALYAYEAGLCECGWHESLTQDRTNHFTFEDKVCNVCAGSAQYARTLADRDQKHSKAMGENAPAGARRPGDGRRTMLRLMSPDEVEARKAKPSPAG